MFVYFDTSHASRIGRVTEGLRNLRLAGKVQFVGKAKKPWAKPQRRDLLYLCFSCVSWLFIVRIMFSFFLFLSSLSFIFVSLIVRIFLSSCRFLHCSITSSERSVSLALRSETGSDDFLLLALRVLDRSCHHLHRHCQPQRVEEGNHSHLPPLLKQQPRLK